MTDRSRKEQLLEARLRLSEYANTHGLEELLRRTLDEAELLTGGTIGFLHFFDEETSCIQLQTWSTNTLREMCRVAPFEKHYPLEMAGVWADCIRQERPIIVNDYDSLPHRQGMPAGHAPVRRMLTVPVFRAERVVAVMGTGNKERDYDEDDLEVMEQLANMAWDIAMRKRAQDELVRLNEELESRVRRRTADLEAANKELEAFAYAVSHDLRAPLHGISGLCSMLGDEYSRVLDARGVECLARLRTCADQAARLISELLQLARFAEVEIEWQKVDVSKLASEVVAELRARLPRREVEVFIADGMTAHGDPVLLGTALGHLLENSWKFTSCRSRGSIEMTATNGEHGERLFSVKDNGAGFEMARASRLFLPFERLHPGTEFDGMGVGLATAQRIIRRHGGRIWAEAEPDRGATFRFTLPLANPGHRL